MKTIHFQISYRDPAEVRGVNRRVIVAEKLVLHSNGVAEFLTTAGKFEATEADLVFKEAIAPGSWIGIEAK